jgi:1,4-alpha-glucan branching enzyme
MAKKESSSKMPGKGGKAAFQLKAPGAQAVSVAGSFNNWQPQPMKAGASSVWKVSLSLMPGKYEYKFVVDGNWIVDPACGEARPDGHGGVNSVCSVA